MLSIDQVLGKGRYRILSSFANDAAGGLYEAYDTVSNSTVVLRENVGRFGKVATATQLDALNEAFRDEAKVLSKIRHEALLSVQDYFSEIDRHYLVMESVDGYDLTKLLKSDEKPPAMTDVLSWADQILDALNFLHSLPKPRIHRDIRPANIRLSKNFKIKLVTAGISAGEEADLITPSAGNQADIAVLNYRPLEQLWGGLDPASQKVIVNSYDEASQAYLMQPLDARCDLYSLGATIYHIITRTLPKDALERSIEVLEGRADPLLPPCEIDVRIPSEISDVLMKSLKLGREERFESAAIMRQAFRTAQVLVKERKASEASAPRVAPEPLSEVAESAPVSQVIESVSEIEKETLLVEQRRQELEAEQHRLEEERQRLERKRLELEAEEKQRAEQRRLEGEAEEKKRADQRRLEIEADLRRQREEAERIRVAEIEALAARKAAEARAARIVEEPPILELDPAPVAAAGANSFEWSDEELDLPGVVTVPVQASIQPEVSAYIENTPRRMEFDLKLPAGLPEISKRNYLIAGALILVLALAFGWMFLGTPRSDSPSASEGTVFPSEPVGQQVEQTVAPAAQDQPAYTTVPAPAFLGSDTQPVNQDQVNAPAVARPKSKKPAAAKSPSQPKKSVTVDDIINDN